MLTYQLGIGCVYIAFAAKNFTKVKGEGLGGAGGAWTVKGVSSLRSLLVRAGRGGARVQAENGLGGAA